MRLDFVIPLTYVPHLTKSEGLENCLVSPILLTISVKPGSSAAYRSPKSLSRWVSARRASIFGKTITLDQEMPT